MHLVPHTIKRCAFLVVACEYMRDRAAQVTNATKCHVALRLPPFFVCDLRLRLAEVSPAEQEQFDQDQ